MTNIELIQRLRDDFGYLFESITPFLSTQNSATITFMPREECVDQIKTWQLMTDQLPSQYVTDEAGFIIEMFGSVEDLKRLYE